VADVSEKLNLKLGNRKYPMDAQVVDRIERLPAEN